MEVVDLLYFVHSLLLMLLLEVYSELCSPLEDLIYCKLRRTVHFTVRRYRFFSTEQTMMFGLMRASDL